MSRRRGSSPTELVVNYFMTGDLAAVEQALIIGGAIIANRRATPTATAPRKHVRKPAVVKTGTAPGAPEVAKPAPVTGAAQQTAAAQSPRRRTRPVAVPADGAPKRRRGRPAGSKNVATTTPAVVAVDTAPVVPPTALPPQGDEPIVD